MDTLREPLTSYERALLAKDFTRAIKERNYKLLKKIALKIEATKEEVLSILEGVQVIGVQELQHVLHDRRPVAMEHRVARSVAWGIFASLVTSVADVMFPFGIREHSAVPGGFLAGAVTSLVADKIHESRSKGRAKILEGDLSLVGDAIEWWRKQMPLEELTRYDKRKIPDISRSLKASYG